jgi:hypothetical protein
VGVEDRARPPPWSLRRLVSLAAPPAPLVSRLPARAAAARPFGARPRAMPIPIHGVLKLKRSRDQPGRARGCQHRHQSTGSWRRHRGAVQSFTEHSQSAICGLAAFSSEPNCETAAPNMITLLAWAGLETPECTQNSLTISPYTQIRSTRWVWLLLHDQDQQCRAWGDAHRAAGTHRANGTSRKCSHTALRRPGIISW